MELQPRGRKGALRGTIRQRRLLTSFIELMNEGSAFSDVKIEDIAKRAGITRAAFYYFFESKEQLLLAELDGFVQQLIEAASSFFTGAGDDIRRELHDALVAVARQRRELQGLSRAFSEAATTDHMVRAALVQAFEAVVPRVAARLAQIRARRGPTISEADAQNIARTLLWANERNFYRLSVGPSLTADWEQLVEALFAIWIGALVGTGSE